MKISQRQQELIQKYLSDSLSDKDQKSFDTEIKNPIFRSALLEQTQLLQAIELSGDNALRERFKAIDTDPSENNNPKKDKSSNTKNSFLKYAAILLFLLAAAYCIWSLQSNEKQELSNQQLFAEYYMAIPAVRNERGVESPENATFEKAMDLYYTKDYSKALPILNALPTSSMEIDLFKANCLLELEKIEDAKLLFEKVLQEGSIEQQQTSEWYLCLLQLKHSDSEAYKITAKKISNNPNHLYQTKAQKLLSE